MKYRILSSLRTSSSFDAQRILENNVQEALGAGAQLVGGVSVVFGVPNEAGKPGYEAFQAVMVPEEFPST